VKFLLLSMFLILVSCKSDQYITVIDPEAKTPSKKEEKPQTSLNSKPNDLAQSEEFSFLDGKFISEEDSKDKTSFISLEFSRKDQTLKIEKKINSISKNTSCHVLLNTSYSIFAPLDDINEIYRSNNKAEIDYMVQYRISDITLVESDKVDNGECVKLINGKNELLQLAHLESFISMINTDSDEKLQVGWLDQTLKRTTK